MLCHHPALRVVTIVIAFADNLVLSNAKEHSSLDRKKTNNQTEKFQVADVSILCFSAFEMPLSSIFPVLSSPCAQTVSILLFPSV